MAYSAFKDLRSNIIGCSANGTLLLTFKIEFGGEAEVTQFDHHFLVDEKIAELHIAMDDSVRVQERQGADDLIRVALDQSVITDLKLVQ